MKGGVPCYLHLNRWIPIKDVRKLIWGYLSEVDKLVVRVAHDSKTLPSEYAYSTYVSEYCALFGYLSLLKWARANALFISGLEVCLEAAKRGDFEMIKWLKEQDYRCDERTSYYAARFNHFTLLKWLSFNKCPFDCQTFVGAVESNSNNFPMLNWLKRKYPNDWNVSPDLYRVPLKTGNLKLAKWLHQNGVSTRGQHVTQFAVRSGKLKVLKWALTHGCPLGPCVSEEAARTENWDLLKWLRTKKHCPVGNHECLCIIKSGNLPMLKWARENGYPFLHFTLNFRIQEKHFECVEWAVDHGCPWVQNAMYMAFQSGNFNVVRWLHEKGCPWPEELDITFDIKIEHCMILEWALKRGCPWPKNLRAFRNDPPEVQAWLNANKA